MRAVARSAAGSVSVILDEGAIRAAVMAAIARRRGLVRARCVLVAEAVTVWMRENAPWQDVTGRARASLRAEVREFGWGFQVALIGGGGEVDYMPVLEFRETGRFAILRPALEQFGPELVQAVQGALHSIG